MATWSFLEKTDFTAGDTTPGNIDNTSTPFSASEKATILAAMQTAYDGSGIARTMFENWVAGGGRFTVSHITGDFYAYPKTGEIYLDLNFIKGLSYIDDHGQAIEHTATDAIIHELGHALTGKRDNFTTTDYEGDNVKFVNTIWEQLGFHDEISYIAQQFAPIQKVGYQYTDGAPIDAAHSGDVYDNKGNFITADWSSKPLGNSDDLLIGSEKNNKLQSGAGNDFLAGESGNDTLDGGEGDRDTAIYFDTNPADYDIRRNSDGKTWTIKHVRGDGLDAAKSDGVDTLQNIELLQFGAKHYTLGVDPVTKKGGLTFETDFAFVIDTTGSMGDDIDSVKEKGTTLINALFADGTVDARVGIVGFKDTTDGEPSETILNFADQDKLNSFADRKALALSKLDSITVGGGGDLPETDDDGLLRALDGRMGDWRVDAGVHRIVLFTDAPVKDIGLRAQVDKLASDLGAAVERHTSLVGSGGEIDTFSLSFSGSSVAGLVPSSDPSSDVVVSPVNSLDPVSAVGSNSTLQIFTIFTGPSGTDTSGLSDIAASTGGSFLTAADDDALVKAILDIINIPPDQTIIGSDGNDTLDGGEGNDLIRGLAGNDILRGHGGIDFLDGGPGADTIDGGAGFDLASWLGETSGLTLNLANQALNAGSGLGDTVTNVEAFYLTNFVDSFTGGTTGVFVYGFDGNDKITGSSVSDIIDGGPGADTIDAAGGFDYVSYYSSATGVTLDLKNPANNTGDAKGDVITNAEAYILTSKDDTFIGTDSGQNIVFGYEGNDTLKGGFNANNWFFAGDGNDRMVGGGVQDLFVGGNGADTIAFATPKPIAGSSVFGFTPGTDVLEISRAAFGLSAGYAVTAGSTLVSGTGPVATTAQPTFFYYTNLGLLYFDPDGTGSTAATLLAQFDTHPALTAADFHLV
jgi:Ca2+-binding RTX toxin-like protein